MNKNAKKVASAKIVREAKELYAKFDEVMAPTIRALLAKNYSKGDISRALTQATNKVVIYQWIRNVSLTPLKK